MKKEMKNQKKRKRKKFTSAALTGRPSIAPTRAERGSTPLTGGA
jgi:hypothetical protein